ncbi:MAG: hypothetical protein JWP57_1082 [Spirosoma sp.]|nr:hypothetical protein [Spirosoma sp.]
MISGVTYRLFGREVDHLGLFDTYQVLEVATEILGIKQAGWVALK